MPTRPGTEPFSHDAGPVGVLLCHGFTGSPASLRPWAQHLAEQGRTVRLPLLPGHGTSWQEMNRTTWQDWYGALDEAVRELHSRCDAVVVAGLSMGGALATRVAQDHGPRIRGLVLVNPAYRVDDPRLRALPFIKALVPSLRGIANDIALADQDELGYDRIPLRALHSQTRLWAEVVRDLPEVIQPVLLFQSRQDHVVPRSSTDLFLARAGSKDVTEVVLEDSFHVATLDHDAERIRTQSDAFIDRVTR